MSEATYLVFDAETGGVDTENDRIIQLVIALTDANGNILSALERIIDPGVEISEESIAVHGFTNEYLKENGSDPGDALEVALGLLTEHTDIPWVAYNLNFDLSILNAEAKRHLGVRLDWVPNHIRLIDPLVIDRAKDRYRKGNRKLVTVAGHYGVALDESKLHNALYDVEVTAKVAAAVVRKFGLPTNEEQAEWHAAWAENFETYLRGVKGDDSIVIERGWPLREKEEN